MIIGETSLLINLLGEGWSRAKLQQNLPQITHYLLEKKTLNNVVLDKLKGWSCLEQL